MLEVRNGDVCKLGTLGRPARTWCRKSSFASYRAGSQFTTWMYRIARNASIDGLRSLVNALMLRPLPYNDPVRLEEPERLLGAPVSEDYFRVMGTPPLLGRTFLPQEFLHLAGWGGPPGPQPAPWPASPTTENSPSWQPLGQPLFVTRLPCRKPDFRTGLRGPAQAPAIAQGNYRQAGQPDPGLDRPSLLAGGELRSLGAGWQAVRSPSSVPQEEPCQGGLGQGAGALPVVERHKRTSRPGGPPHRR